MAVATVPTTKLDKIFKTAAGVLGLGALALTGLGLAMKGDDANALAHSFLYGWVFWACLTFGCFGLSLLHHAARGHWGFPIIRIFEAGGGPLNLGIFGLALLPILTIWKSVFFPWARPDEVALDPVLKFRAVYHYFDDSFVLGRWLIYFAAFIVMAYLNQKWLKNEEQTGNDSWWKKRQWWGGIFLVIFCVCTNFLWTDVLMSQYAHWYSTIYGVWFIVGSALLAFSMVAVIVGTQSKKAPYNKVVEPWFLKDIGNWMLTFTMLWGYFSLSQYLIIWSGNLPEFTKYFIDRSVNGWGVLGTLLIPLHFFVPFIALLSPNAKRKPMLLASIGVYILFIRAADLLYIVTPAWKKSLGITPLDIGMFLLFGAVWCALFGWQIGKAKLITHRSIELKEAFDHA